MRTNVLYNQIMRIGGNKMDNKGQLFVKVNYKVKGTGNNIRCDARINYIDPSNSSKYSIGGGFSNKDSCSFAFKASNIEEARGIMDQNPFLKRWKSRYNDIKWDLTIVPAF